MYRKRENVVVFLVAILDAILNMIILQLAKCVSFNSPITSLQDLIKMQTNIQTNKQTNIRFQISVIDSVVGNMYLVDILDAIFNF